jgi:methionyl-tRNA formyltransferase
MNVLFCAYRDWGLSVYQNFVEKRSYLWHKDSKKIHCSLCSTKESLEEMVKSQHYDIIVLLGWSWKVPNHIVDSHYVIGMHPSDLPDYAGGSPLQNQILDGLTMTKATLFKLDKNFDSGPILGKVDLSLEGHIEDIFKNLSAASNILLDSFFQSYPNITEIAQTKTFSKKRLKPEDSSLTKEKLLNMSAKKLYDEIRCREDPYPNVTLEDETGTLIFKRVEFIPK